MTFESLVLLTMAEEHIANKRPDTELSDWKPLKVDMTFILTIF